MPNLSIHDPGGADHGGVLHWPGTQEGIPVRGNPGHLTQEEYAAIKTVAEFKCRTFRLSDATDAEAYKTIRDRAEIGWYRIVHITRDTTDLDHIKVYLEWFQRYGEVDPNVPRTPNARPALFDSL